MEIKFSALALIGLIATAPALADEQTVTFSVPGMFCASCPYIVEAAMGGVKGVHSVLANSETRTALVVFDDDVTSVELIGVASENAGYEVELIDAKS